MEAATTIVPGAATSSSSSSSATSRHAKVAKQHAEMANRARIAWHSSKGIVPAVRFSALGKLHADAREAAEKATREAQEAHARVEAEREAVRVATVAKHYAKTAEREGNRGAQQQQSHKRNENEYSFH